jgi:hypothetical protein
MSDALAKAVARLAPISLDALDARSSIAYLASRSD